MSSKVKKKPIRTTATKPAEQDIDKLLCYFDKSLIDYSKLKIDRNGSLRNNETHTTRIYSDSFIEDKTASRFVNEIRRSLLSLPVSIDDVKNEKYGYQFPSKDDVEYYRFKNQNHNLSPLINENYETIDNAIKLYVANKEKSCQVSVLTGKVGSGKTAFVNYLNCIYKESLFKQRLIVITTRYVTEDIEAELEKTKDEWKKYFIEQFSKSLVFLVFDEKYEELSEFITDFEKDILIELYEDSEDHHIADDVFERSKKEIKRLIDKKNKKKRLTEPFVSNLSIYTKMFIYRYLVLKGFSFLSIIDGFDVFSLEKLLSTNQKYIGQVLADLIAGRFKSLDKNTRYLVVLRSCTYSHLKHWYTEHGGYSVNEYELVPVGISKILVARINSFVKNSEINYVKNGDDCESDLSIFMLHLFSVIKDHFNIDSDGSLVSLFNENYRRLLDFCFDVILFYIDRIVYDYGAVGSSNRFIELFGYKELLQKYLPSHILVERYVLSSNDCFKNYYQYPLDGGLRGKPNTDRGYVDNLYNYDLDVLGLTDIDNPMLPPFLIKIRIIQSCMIANAHISSDEILKQINLLGYTCKLDRLNEILEFLINVGFLRPRVNSKGELLYNTTKKGEFCVNTLLSEIRYTENVIPQSLYPVNMLRDMIVANKYYLSQEGNISEVSIKWVYASIINNFIHFQYISCLEQQEKKLGYPSNIGQPIGRGKWSLNNNVFSIKQAIRKILNNPVGDSLYLDVTELINDINELVNNSNYFKSTGDVVSY